MLEGNEETTLPRDLTFDELLRSENVSRVKRPKEYDLLTAEGQKQKLVSIVEDPTTTDHVRVRAMELLSELCGNRRDQRVNDLERLDNKKLMELLWNVARPVLARVGIDVKGKPLEERGESDPEAKATGQAGPAPQGINAGPWDSRMIKGWGTYLHKDACICCFKRAWNYRMRRICVLCKKRLEQHYGSATNWPTAFAVPKGYRYRDKPPEESECSPPTRST